MGIILDTNVISETIRPRPDPKVMKWFLTQSSDDLFLPSVCLAELWRGVDRLPDNHARKAGYDGMTGHIAQTFAGRILYFDNESARIWGRLMGQAERKGRTLPVMDAQIASLALQHELPLATRNTKDFFGLGIKLVNPFH